MKISENEVCRVVNRLIEAIEESDNWVDFKKYFFECLELEGLLDAEKPR